MKLLWEDISSRIMKISSWPLQIVLKAKQICSVGNNQVQPAAVEVMIKLWELREFIFIQAEGIPSVIPVQPCAIENEVTSGITLVHILVVFAESSRTSVLHRPRMLFSTKFAFAGHRNPRGDGGRACCYPGSRHSSSYLTCKRIQMWTQNLLHNVNSKVTSWKNIGKIASTILFSQEKVFLRL